jgi:hypothetical protein
VFALSRRLNTGLVIFSKLSASARPRIALRNSEGPQHDRADKNKSSTHRKHIELHRDIHALDPPSQFGDVTLADESLSLKRICCCDAAKICAEQLLKLFSI